MGKPDIVKMKAKGNVKGLIKALEHEAYDIRVEAAMALGEIGDARAVEPLIQALKDKDRDVRASAAVTLWEIGDERAVAPLTKALKDEYELVRKIAKDALKVKKAKKS
ncbi:hypothetical protein ES703_04590 [subsurface metagenome]